ncbi:hypothetical protein COB21_06260, partial [Candidatus Aerophobetes bacterium]
DLTKSAHARAYQKELFEKRRLSQPYNAKSLGCFFKNPPGLSAGQIIDELGLKGLVQGGAQISEQHGNFFINKGGATGADFLKLVEMVQARVLGERGIELEMEVSLAKPKIWDAKEELNV